MEFSYNREKAELLRVMKSKAEKKNIKVTEYGGKLEVCLESDKFKNGEDAIPVTFKGNFSDTDTGCSLKGRFGYGFYLYTLVIVAVVLIIARFVWSVYQNQTDNMILCGIVTALLIVVIVVVIIKSKTAKKVITEFLNDLNIK